MKNLLGKIKSFFVKAEPLDSTPSESMSPIDNFESYVDDTVMKEKPEEINVFKKSISAAKSIIDKGNFSVFANESEEVKEINKNEFKKSWFISIIKIIVSLIIVFVVLLCLVMIYKLCYGMLNNTDISSFGNYSDFMVTENNLAPAIKENDLLIIEKQDFYSEGDIILYEYAGSSHKLGKVEDIVRGYYIVTDNNIKVDDYNSKISEDLIIGKEIKQYTNVKGIYDFIQSPLSIVLLVIIIALYFFLISKGKIEERRTI